MRYFVNMVSVKPMCCVKEIEAIANVKKREKKQ